MERTSDNRISITSAHAVLAVIVVLFMTSIQRTFAFGYNYFSHHETLSGTFFWIFLISAIVFGIALWTAKSRFGSIVTSVTYVSSSLLIVWIITSFLDFATYSYFRSLETGLGNSSFLKDILGQGLLLNFVIPVTVAFTVAFISRKSAKLMEEDIWTVKKKCVIESGVRIVAVIMAIDALRTFIALALSTPEPYLMSNTSAPAKAIYLPYVAMFFLALALYWIAPWLGSLQKNADSEFTISKQKHLFQLGVMLMGFVLLAISLSWLARETMSPYNIPNLGTFEDYADSGNSLKFLPHRLALEGASIVVALVLIYGPGNIWSWFTGKRTNS